MSERKRKRRHRSKRTTVTGRILTALLAIPAAYMLAALIGSFVPLNRGWAEPEHGITIYLADNGLHSDIIMPARAAGLDWSTVLRRSDAAAAPADAGWVAFGSGEERVYLQTPTWWDIRPATIWAVLTGSRRVLHVEWIDDPSYAERQIRLRPEEYRRLWAALRADFRLDDEGRPVRIDHPGYDCCDSFYWAGGGFNALTTCNAWTADKLRLAGVKTSLWPPFVPGLLWRYRKVTERSG
ncbi:TIGR02117 family protein [Sphingomonas sp. RG327]|uniref:TIGR02117 family protein n=1 Tax=Sphingomonas anseongensis TaxID=2908207 RepID=A0ABT0RFI4_9SPHN|nr:TIGR02117 family protein [Sphingomonas anseongensis]MCL6679034.1 TIGR02117 family protein [Sphingomonas anseongensis]